MLCLEGADPPPDQESKQEEQPSTATEGEVQNPSAEGQEGAQAAEGVPSELPAIENAKDVTEGEAPVQEPQSDAGQQEVPKDDAAEGGEAPVVASETDGTHNTQPLEMALLSDIALCCSSCGLY